MLAEEIKIISSEEVQNYLFANETKDEKKLLLKQKEIFRLPTLLIAQQIAARRKAESKLPLFYKTSGIIYPPSLNLEQSSSEATAKFKADIILKELGSGKTKLADLTGGFGVDSFFFSQVAASLDYVEPNDDLLNIVKHNFSILGIRNIHCNSAHAEKFLESNSKKFDLVYLDPSRRDSQNKKIFHLSHCEPNIETLLPTLFEHSEYVLLKASPLLDIHQGIKELISVKKVFVISVMNECKELLFLLQKNFSDETSIETYNLENNAAVKHYFHFKFDEEKNTVSVFGEPQIFLYEPNASILKSGAFKLIGRKFELNKLHPSTHLYSSNKSHKDFPGRIFQIENLKFDVKLLTEKKANIITRNYPLKPEEMKKKFKITDGGESYVIAFSGQEKKYIVLAKRLA